MDLFELNEAFAAQSLAVVKELGLDANKVEGQLMIYVGVIYLKATIISGVQILAAFCWFAAFGRY